MEDSSSPFFLSVWPRSWRTGRNTRHHWARRAAPAAQTGGPPRGILFPLPVTPCHVARFAHRAAFNGWMCAAARARASVPPCPIAPPAPVTRKRAAPFRVSAAVWYASRLGLRASCALGLATLFAAVPAQGPIGRGPRLPAPRTHAAGDPLGGNAFIPPPPACTFFLGIFVWHVPSFRGCGPGEGRPADLWPAGHPRGRPFSAPCACAPRTGPSPPIPNTGCRNRRSSRRCTR